MGLPDWILLALVAAAAWLALRTWRRSGSCSCCGKHPSHPAGCSGCCGSCAACAHAAQKK